MANGNKFEVTILPDGTIKIESPGSFDLPIHGAAEKLLGNMLADLGGNYKKEKIGKVHTHSDGTVHSHEDDKVKA